MDLTKFNPPTVVKKIAQRYKAGYSPVVLIVGKMRIGKTTKAYLFAQILSQMLFNHSWEWRNNTIVSFDQFVEKIDNPNPEILIIDECQRIFSKRDIFKADSVLFSKLITSQAYKHYIVMLILPRASALATEHAYNVNYVIPVSNRKLCQPYRIESNEWDIALKQKKINKFPLSHFELDINKKEIKKVFAEELTHLSEFKKFIEDNLKEPIMKETMEALRKRKNKQIEEELKQFL